MTSRMARAAAAGAMAAGAVVVVTTFGAPGGAQTDASSAIVHDGVDRAPAVSDDGSTIVFATSPDAAGAPSSLVVHDRGPLGADGAVLAPATTPVVDSDGATNPSISGDGCVVAWSVPAVTDAIAPDPAPPAEQPVTPPDTGAPDAGAGGASEPGAGDPNAPVDGEDTEATGAPRVDGDVATVVAAPARIVVLDRCTAPEAGGIRVDLPLSDDDLSFGPAALALDGSVLAVSNGTDVIRFERGPGAGYAETARIDGADGDAADHLVARRVGISDDGSVVVFGAGLDLADVSSMTVFATVTDATGAVSTGPVLSSSTDPSVSGDGTLVVGSSGADGSSVALVDRTATPPAPVDLGPGRRPSISRDGNHVVFEEGANIAVVSRTGQGDRPYATTQRTPLSSTVTPTGAGPVVDRHGTTVVSDEPLDEAAPSADSDITVTVVGADAGFDAATFDLGRGDVGEVLTATATFSNRGSASVGVGQIAIDGGFTITEDRCGAVVRPGSTCEIDVEFTVDRLGDASGVVTLTPTSFGATSYSATVVALGAAPPTTTPETTATTTPRTGSGTTGGTRTGSTTGRTSRGTTTRGSRGGSTGGSRGSITTGGSRTTTTTVAPGTGVSASPTAFEFAPTIVDAGRRTGLVEIVNNGVAPVTVVGVSLEPVAAGPFQIVETTCSGAVVAVSARCAVTLSFAPVEVGPQNVSLVASLDGGVDITVPVTGTGAPPPVVTVVPGVATIGQVVTLSGAGFPTGIEVDLEWGATTRRIVVDDAGTFDLPVVVMPHTPTGPATVSVAGQPDMFGDVTATMLVTHTGDRARPSVIDGLGPSIGR